MAPVLESWGYATECFPGGGPAADRIEALAPGGGPIIVVSDLLMPRVDGGGLLGGIELLERVRRRHASLPFVLLADHLQEEAEARARLLDVDFTIAKPRSVVLAEGPESPAWRGFLGVLRPILESFHRPRLSEAPSPEVPREARADSKDDVPREARADSKDDVPREARADSDHARADRDQAVPRPGIRRGAAVGSGEERADSGHARAGASDATAEGDAEGTIDLRRALGGISDPDLFEDGVRAPERATTPGLAILKSMLCELTNPETGAEITLLILRFAAEIMNRSVLFMVKGGEAIGLGGFGLGPGVLGDEAPAARRPSLARGAELRRIRIPLKVPSVFHDVAEKQSVVRGPLDSSPGNDRLRALLGGGEPVEAFVAPIAVGDEVVALLYGDNLPEQRPVGETEALEIFLTQAGLALEKAILERRLLETVHG
jgi:CheY-like chemotaxis protein